MALRRQGPHLHQPQKEVERAAVRAVPVLAADGQVSIQNSFITYRF